MTTDVQGIQRTWGRSVQPPPGGGILPPSGAGVPRQVPVPDQIPSPAEVELTLAARPENVAVVRHVLGGVGDVLALDPETLGDLRLAVSEACTNVVVHAYDEAGSGVMQIEARIQAPLLHVTVRDHGRGVAPRPDSPGLRVGLPMMAALTESLELANVDGATEVRMTFLIPAPA